MKMRDRLIQTELEQCLRLKVCLEGLHIACSACRACLNECVCRDAAPFSTTAAIFSQPEH